ncbi:MAG: 3-hydroxyacyl-CoA dehydrogenase family protein [Nocardioides sp.]|nr:3-hydroxyacyl-CoA dehydrogenase family protein [Nocardioides sp.]
MSTSMVVVGGGTMGRGIAIAALATGFEVTLVDVAEDVLDRAQARVSDHFARHPQPDRGVLHTTTSLAGSLETAEALKTQIFQQLRGAPPATLLVSNTSTMSISALAEACGGSSRVVGMHFFNPAHRMPLVEVVVGARTSDDARDRAVALAVRLGKDPIVVRDLPGFVTSRLGLILGTEAMRMVEEQVANAADIDKALRLGYGHPMGPLELADLVGLDARLNNLRSMFERSGDAAYEPPAVLVDLVTAGHLGKKSGRGFYDYEAQS